MATEWNVVHNLNLLLQTLFYPLYKLPIPTMRMMAEHLAVGISHAEIVSSYHCHTLNNTKLHNNHNIAMRGNIKGKWNHYTNTSEYIMDRITLYIDL